MTIWKTIPYSIDGLDNIHDFEERFVNADLESIPFQKAFPEIIAKLNWSISNEIQSNVEKHCTANQGLTDIAWFCPRFKIGFVVRSFTYKAYVIKADSIAELKEKLLNEA